MQGEVELKRLREREEALRKENLQIRKELELNRSDRENDGSPSKLDELNTTQRARHLFFERKIKRIEVENRALKDKLVAVEMEKQHIIDKSAILTEKLQDLELIKAKIRKNSDELQGKDSIIRKLELEISKKPDLNLSKAGLEGYKSQIHSSRTSRVSPAPSRGSYVSSNQQSPKSNTDLRLFELATSLRRTQDEIERLKKSDGKGNSGRKDMDRHAASPRSVSQEGRVGEERKEELKKRQGLFEILRSPSHPSDTPRPVGPQTPASDKPLVSKLQLLRAMKKPGVSIFKPTTSKSTAVDSSVQGFRGAGQRAKLGGR